VCSYVSITDMYQKGEWGVLQRVPLLVFHWWWFVSLPLVVVPKSGHLQCYMNTCSSARKMYGKFEPSYTF
jgi:hypothetical protein